MGRTWWTNVHLYGPERPQSDPPENTASVVRSFVENKLYAEPMPLKVFYIGPMFRYDRPQAGRMRQFHQFGVEALGAESPVVDAEVILLALTVLKRFGLKDLKLKINSVGCPNCKLTPEAAPRLLPVTPGRTVRRLPEPVRPEPAADPGLQVDADKPFMAGAPKITDSLCDDCRAHFETVKKLLDEAGVEYEVDSNLVRGWITTKTAFEISILPGCPEAL